MASFPSMTFCPSVCMFCMSTQSAINYQLQRHICISHQQFNPGILHLSVIFEMAKYKSNFMCHCWPHSSIVTYLILNMLERCPWLQYLLLLYVDLFYQVVQVWNFVNYETIEKLHLSSNINVQFFYKYLDKHFGQWLTN